MAEYPILSFEVRCLSCDFSTNDLSKFDSHECPADDYQSDYCEDYPCCGHERGDCRGLRYGSDESIKRDVERAYRDEDYAYAMERQAEYDEMWGGY